MATFAAVLKASLASTTPCSNSATRWPARSRLADRVETAYALEAQLLLEHQRARLRHEIERHETSRQQLDVTTSRALEASATLADTPANDARHRAAATELITARSTRDQLAAQAPELKAGAAAAQQRLEADDARRRQYGPAIAARDTAWSTLRTRLRTTIATAIERDELLPPWFLNHVGPTPPGEKQQHWWDTATDVLAYRITYQVNDSSEPEVSLASIGVERRRQGILPSCDGIPQTFTPSLLRRSVRRHKTCCVTLSGPAC